VPEVGTWATYTVLRRQKYLHTFYPVVIEERWHPTIFLQNPRTSDRPRCGVVWCDACLQIAHPAWILLRSLPIPVLSKYRDEE